MARRSRRPRATELGDPTDCVYYLVSRATLAVTGTLKQALAAAGVDVVRPAYLGVLLALWKEDGQRAVDLCRTAGLEPSTMTGMLDRMERDGLLGREPDPDDRRAFRIRLTPRGWEVREPVLSVVDQTLAAVMEGVSERDNERLKATLRTVLESCRRLGDR